MVIIINIYFIKRFSVNIIFKRNNVDIKTYFRNNFKKINSFRRWNSFKINNIIIYINYSNFYIIFFMLND